MKKHKNLILGLSALVFSVFGRFLYLENNALTKTKLKYVSKKIPKSFEKFKILQISDLHNKLFGKNQEKLIRNIIEENPDIIVVTGDIYFSYNKKITNSMLFLRQISQIYPVYFVTGNHEQRDKKWDKHRKVIESFGVKILDNKIERIYKDKDFIQLYGLKDPSFYFKTIRYKVFEEKLKKLQSKLDDSKLGILLSHRPERFNIYEQNGVDLVFCGHAHGGQIRLGNIGIISPGEGFFPKYTAGKYEKGKTTMILSRGLGRTIFPTRLFNRPDIVIVSLHSE